MARRVTIVLVTLLALAALVGCASSPATRVTPAAPDALATALAVPTNAAGYRDLSVAQFSALVKAHPEVVLVNVHTPYEGELADTDLEAPYDDIPGMVGLLPADKAAPVALYCLSGGMSDKAGAALAKEGYTQVFELDGGMNAWKEAGLQVLIKR